AQGLLQLLRGLVGLGARPLVGLDPVIAGPENADFFHDGSCSSPFGERVCIGGPARLPVRGPYGLADSLSSPLFLALVSFTFTTISPRAALLVIFLGGFAPSLSLESL